MNKVKNLNEEVKNGSVDIVQYILKHFENFLKQ